MSMSPKATAIALATTLVIAFVLCGIAQKILPGAQFSHMWLNLFTSAPLGSTRAWVEGIIASAVAGTVIGYIFACIYNKSSK